MCHKSDLTMDEWMDDGTALLFGKRKPRVQYAGQKQVLPKFVKQHMHLYEL